MNVSGVSSGPVVSDLTQLLRTLPQTLPEILPDTVSLLHPELADPDVRKVLDTVDRFRTQPSNEPLIHAALAQHNMPEVVRLVSALAATNPDAAHALLREPTLHLLHEIVREAIQRVTFEARIDTEKVLTAAAPYQLAAPQMFIAANRLFETGQYVNYIRARALASAVISAGSASHPPRIPWNRAPLLILMAAWLLTGLLGWAASRGAPGAAFDVWAIGFLALVGIQFCITIRNARLRPIRLSTPPAQTPPADNSAPLE